MDAESVLPAGSSPLPLDVSAATEPITKNIFKQDRLYSTKKRRKLDDGPRLKSLLKQELREILAEARSSAIPEPLHFL